MVWGDPEDREELNLTTAQEQNYVICWRFREEARIQGASQSQVPCPCHYAAGKEAGPHVFGDKDMQCGCCAGTCEQCRPELDPRRPRQEDER